MAMNKWGKWWQRQILDSLMMNPPPSLTLILAIVFGSVFGVGFLCAHWIDQVDLANYKPFSILTDNIGGVAFNVMSDILPVDVVYTWVNGSDEKLLKEIELLTKSNFTDKGCKLQNCFPSEYYAVRKVKTKNQKSSNDFEVIKSISDNRNNLSNDVVLVKVKKHFHFPDLKQKIQQHFGVNASIQLTFWTSEIDFDGKQEMPNSIFLRLDKDADLRVQLHSIDPEFYDKYYELCSVVKNKELIVLDCKEKSTVVRLRKRLEKYVNLTSLAYPKLFPASLSLANSERTTNSFDMNRFNDNEELRYSLRSLEKYAPWVRRVFLVTNGQVPYWLNLDHPKLTLITHDQLFPDKSHLPTYSSPAIESHIHLIPGLSDHFLYFNDDILLGAPIYPDDFYSASSGYKIYLSWPLPECSSGCPGSWIRDGYCDRACNNTECNWDGGDCEGDNSPPDYIDDAMNEEESNNCHDSCTDSWLADSYCDLVCSASSCGFDAGDCGVDLLIKHLHEVAFVNLTSQTIFLPKGVVSAWMNISSLFRDGESVDVQGSYAKVKGVRSVAVNTQNKVIVWVFRPNITGIVNLQLNFTKEDQESVTLAKVKKFQLHFDTRSVVKERNDSLDNNVTLTIKHFSFSEVHPKIETKLLVYDNQSNTVFTNDSLSKLPEKVQLTLSQLNRMLDEGFLTKFGVKVKQNEILETLKRNSTNSFNGSLRHLLYFEENGTVGETLGSYRGHFPWEKSLKKVQQEPKSLKVGRKLLDEFANSLLFVNKLYNSEYGFEARKVPAHMPHYIDKTLLQELQQKFAYEFHQTSSHKFREGTDMQFAFSYYYYLMNEKIHRTPGEIFDSFDTDHSGTWSDREIRTYLAKTNSLPLRYEDVVSFQNELKSCHEQHNPPPVPVMPYERYIDSDLPTISRALVESCATSFLIDRLKPLKTVSRFEFSVSKDPPVDFKMITSNLSTVIHHLDEIRKNTKKFVCLNSDLDPRGADNDIIRAMILDTYESLYPVTSSFELPLHYRNKFSYIDEVKQWKLWRNVLRSLIYASVACLLLLVALTFFNKELESFRRKWCKKRRRKLQQEGARV